MPHLLCQLHNPKPPPPYQSTKPPYQSTTSTSRASRCWIHRDDGGIDLGEHGDWLEYFVGVSGHLPVEVTGAKI
jgi:hypothetical protein